MKILMLGWELPPHNSGGLGVACYHLCKSLASSGVDIDFVLPYKSPQKIFFMNILAANPITLRQFGSVSNCYDSASFWHTDTTHRVTLSDQQLAYEKGVVRLVRSRKFDIIHAHDWLTFRAALRVQELSGKPFIAHVHSVERDRAGGQVGNPLVREIEQMAFYMADKIIAVSNLTKKAIVKDYGIPADKIEVVHNSMDLGQIDQLDNANTYVYLELMKRQGYKVISNIGRLTIQKGLTNLLHAAQQVIDREPKTLFLIVGAGDQYHELITLAADLGISKNVIFVGFQRGKPWRDAFAVADLFVLPSVSEPFGLTPLEAIGYGTPVLLSRQTGVAEVLKHALRVDFWDVNAMANQLVAAVQNEPLRQELWQNAYRELNKMSWQQAADKVADIYSLHHKTGAVA